MRIVSWCLVLAATVATLVPMSARAAAPAVIAVDGSSTVFPISEAVAEEFQKTNPARVTVGLSGTGGGFKKFCRGETAISDASRPIKESEVVTCGAAKIDYIELPVAFDGLSVVVNPKATWVDKMTVAELKKLWAPEAQGKVMKWSDVRPGWPNKEIHLYGPSVDNGTYDYFTDAIVGKEHSSRGDYTSGVDPNVLVQGISNDPLALGFFAYVYYKENAGRLKLVPVDGGKGPVSPSPATVAGGTYQPLSRPIFIYVSKAAAARPEVKAFVDFYLANAPNLVPQVGYIPLTDRIYGMVKARFAKLATGSVFGGKGATPGVTIEQLLGREK